MQGKGWNVGTAEANGTSLAARFVREAVTSADKIRDVNPACGFSTKSSDPGD
jgi:hypothetical protein